MLLASASRVSAWVCGALLMHGCGARVLPEVEREADPRGTGAKPNARSGVVAKCITRMGPRPRGRTKASKLEMYTSLVIGAPSTANEAP